VTIKFTNIFYSEALQNLPKLEFLVQKIYHLATLARHQDSAANAFLWQRCKALAREQTNRGFS
jgi:hypothetical protein